MNGLSEVSDARPTVRTGPIVIVADRDPGGRRPIVDVVLAYAPDATVIEIASGAAFVDATLRRKPTLVFVGLQLDDVSGPEAVALARKSGGVIPCLILVATRVFPQWQDIAQSLGAYEVLKKPFDPRHIASLLDANTRRHQPTPVLLASSSATVRGLVARVLAGSGFNLDIDETNTGHHALSLLRAGSYPIAFLDVGLADIDGLEIACQAQELGVGTKLTLLTAGDSEPVAKAARYFGVSFVLRMPFYPRDIDLALHHALDLRRPYLLNALTAPPAPTALVQVGPPPVRRLPLPV